MHCNIAVERNQQLSRMFYVAETLWLLVVQMMFVDDDATQAWAGVCSAAEYNNCQSLLRICYRAHTDTHRITE